MLNSPITVFSGSFSKIMLDDNESSGVGRSTTVVSRENVFESADPDLVRSSYSNVLRVKAPESPEPDLAELVAKLLSRVFREKVSESPEPLVTLDSTLKVFSVKVAESPTPVLPNG